MNTSAFRYVGRFAPSPTGPLHRGSLVAALASCLDARAHAGRWLLRIEDLDRERSRPAAARSFVPVLEALGFRWDGPVVWQSQRMRAYEEAFERLRAMGLVYPCSCTRAKLIDEPAGVDGAPRYPGTCRDGMVDGGPIRAWRLRVPDRVIGFEDRFAGHIEQNLERDVGDFVVRRGDGQWAYQLAVVVDDAASGVTDVVRGADLIDSTPRQILIQELLGLPRPRYLHVPVVLDDHGQKLSKQTGAAAIGTDPLAELRQAAAHLGLLPGHAAAEDGPDAIEAYWSWATGRWPFVLSQHVRMEA